MMKCKLFACQKNIRVKREDVNFIGKRTKSELILVFRLLMRDEIDSTFFVLNAAVV